MINEVNLIGNVGSDPEIRAVGDNKVASFTLATSERYTQNGESKEHTEWHNIVAWGKLADIVEKYVTKGSQLYVQGKNRTTSYETNGITKYITKVNIHTLKLLGKKPSEQKAQTGQTQPTTPSHAPIPDIDDLPF